MIKISAKLAPLVRDLKRYKGQFQRTMKEVVDTEARGFVRDAVGMTPPFQTKKFIKGKQTVAKYQAIAGGEAKRLGEKAITADLLGGGGRYKHERTAGVFSVMDDGMLAATAKVRPNGNVVLFVKKNGEVYGTDQTFYKPNASVSEMKSHHQSQRGKNGRVFKRGGATRDIGRWKFVNKMVVGNKAFRRYEKIAHKKVGILILGWGAAADFVKLRLPAWVLRHATTKGSITSKNTWGVYSLVIRNSVPFGAGLGLQRIADRALAGRGVKLEARLPHVLRGAIKRARLESMRS